MFDLDLAGALRLAISAWIVVVLFRSGRNAWARRDLMLTIWRGMRPSVLARSIALFFVVGLVATLLLEFVPVLRYGLGSLVAFEGNAVFTPLEEAAGALGPAPETGPDWPLVALTTGFLGLLLVLLPWLAFVEEEVFRAGTEVLDLRGELWAALRFGLVHLVMLVPVGATLAIAVAGFAYGRTYRRAALSDGAPEVPDAVLRAFRPTKRSRAAASQRLVEELRAAVAAPAPAAPTPVAPATVLPGPADDRPDLDPGGVDVAVRRFTIESLQAAGVLRAATFHAAFNSLVVVVVWAAITIPALTG